MSVRFELIHGGCFHFEVSAVYELAIRLHEILYLLIEADCVQRLIRCHIEIRLLLHAIEQHIFAWANILNLVHDDTLCLSVKS